MQLYGVVTEISAAARGFLGRGYSITVVHDAVRHLNEHKAHALIAELARCKDRQLAAWRLEVRILYPRADHSI